jgi:hypothetical protein
VVDGFGPRLAMDDASKLIVNEPEEPLHDVGGSVPCRHKDAGDPLADLELWLWMCGQSVGCSANVSV